MDEHKKILYGVFGLAIAIHLGFILSKWIAISFGLSAVLLLIFALYKATSGHRIGMSSAFLIALISHASLFVYAIFLGATIDQEEQRFIRFQAPPPIM